MGAAAAAARCSPTSIHNALSRAHKPTARPTPCPHLLLPQYNLRALARPLARALPPAEPFPSSTWCCNPQFRLTVRSACEVVVALGQQDPRVEHRAHVRKADRRRRIGMMVRGEGE